MNPLTIIDAIAFLQNALIGMDISQYENRRIDTSDYSILESNYSDDMTYPDGYFEVK